MGDMMSNNNNLLELIDVKKYFPVQNGLFKKPKFVKAIDGINMTIRRGETFGLVGESGCGKTTLGRVIIDLYKADSGEIIYDDTNLVPITKNERKKYKGRMQMVFQDPYSSLNTRMSIKEIIREPLQLHTDLDKVAQNARINELLNLVGLTEEHGNRYPHEFSGGQRQRIGIARALAVNPEFIVCDEPTSALDVSVQAQVINMLMDLQVKLGLTYLFIAHDLAVVQHISTRIGVMYLGKLVEVSDADSLFRNPQHPYTKALLSSIPTTDLDNKKVREVLIGDIPSPIDLPEGCRFKTRCKYAFERCSKEEPELKIYEDNHRVACFYQADKK